MESVDAMTRLQIRDPTKIQLFSAQTPNGIKVAACLEELNELKKEDGAFDITSGIYEPHTVDIRHAENRTDAFVDMLSPGGKIPAILLPINKHVKGVDSDQTEFVNVWESGSILLHLAETFKELIPDTPATRIETINWLFWASASLSPQVKQLGFFYKYSTHREPYCVSRYQREVTRMLGVIETQLNRHRRHFLMGDLYTIADIATWPWLYALHENYDDAIPHLFGDLKDFPATQAWYKRCIARPASQRSLEVTPFLK